MYVERVVVGRRRSRQEQVVISLSDFDKIGRAVSGHEPWPRRRRSLNGEPSFGNAILVEIADRRGHQNRATRLP